ncbi:hypothetical protein [Mucilaginibacter sp.]|jgi:hypothetical protein|uniref:hypothetical protein n=1 Tax=Mucilaginibacter sp. TaxID=1882438 RepID=UPI002B58EDB7|nr:hypothetical protein [Mucilaginibacter sp.]HTI60534.1 hypothetical protein [Mucilaginibacter sp.]
MNKKHLLEFIPLITFFLFSLSPLFKLGVPYATIITLVSGGLLSMLYFYASYWLFAGTGIAPVTRIIAGLTFSVTIVAIIYSLFRWPYWYLFSNIGFAGLGIVLVISLFNYLSPGYKALVYRTFLFLILIAAVYSYRSFRA